MTDAVMNIADGDVENPADLSPDGRRLRSERSRKCIVDALIRLIRGQEILPSAERVSEEANVGLRTVYRHFEDMDCLYQEVVEQIEADILPLLNRSFVSTQWREQVFELIDRNAEIFERIMPYKAQSKARMIQSAYLKKKHRSAVEREIARLAGILPENVRGNDLLFAALCTSMSFDAWCFVRNDQGKTPEEARCITRFAVEALLPA
jgi:AcrR family transcriptional regulator